MASSFYAFLLFFVVMFGFLIFKNGRLCAAADYSTDFSQYYTVVFVGALTVVMAVVNVGVMKSRCTTVDAGIIAKATLPWPLIFGTTAIALEFLPSWKIPFANTFGYMLYNFDGRGNDLLKGLLKNDGGETYKFVVEDPGLLANTINLINFKEKSESFELHDAVPVKAFYNKIVLKQMAADFVWYMLVGSVVITMSYNTILTANCTLKA